jgi:hypothetical protein
MGYVGIVDDEQLYVERPVLSGLKADNDKYRLERLFAPNPIWNMALRKKLYGL